jgi:hypothetical protein
VLDAGSDALGYQGTWATHRHEVRLIKEIIEKSMENWTMSETKALNWDDPQIDPTENITEEDVKSAEQLWSRIPVGRYLCTCVESVPRQVDFKEYSCIAANLKWRIDKVLDLGVKQYIHSLLLIGNQNNVFLT